ncbi:MAG: class I SAM-dependent methyltransferase [Negativicutes bacterium]|nr:class I SAM-dependent methyltransferase [Negativicutes bacterium]
MTENKITQQQKGQKGMGMEGFIARWYADNTKKDSERFARDATTIAANIADGARFLEIAPGPGYLSIELAKRGNYAITGLDISKTFVRIARENAAKAVVPVDFCQGDATKMPFDDESFDFIFCSSAFKNFAAPQQVLAEIHRVLRKGGKALIIDLRRDAPLAAIDDYVGKMGLTWLSAPMTRLTFRFMLLPRAYTKAAFHAMISQSEFKQADIRENLLGMEIWLQRQS